MSYKGLRVGMRTGCRIPLHITNIKNKKNKKTCTLISVPNKTGANFINAFRCATTLLNSSVTLHKLGPFRDTSPPKYVFFFPPVVLFIRLEFLGGCELQSFEDMSHRDLCLLFIKMELDGTRLVLVAGSKKQ